MFEFGEGPGHVLKPKGECAGEPRRMPADPIGDAFVGLPIQFWHLSPPSARLGSGF